MTFLKRYNDNLVDPALDALRDDVDLAIAAALPMWSRVGSDGVLVSGSPDVTSSEYTPNPIGRSLVTFPRDVTMCAVVAQNNLNNGNVASELVYNFGGEPTVVLVYFETNPAPLKIDRFR